MRGRPTCPKCGTEGHRGSACERWHCECGRLKDRIHHECCQACAMSDFGCRIRYGYAPTGSAQIIAILRSRSSATGTVTDLSEEMGMKRNSVYVQLERLVKRGRLRRVSGGLHDGPVVYRLRGVA